MKPFIIACAVFAALALPRAAAAQAAHHGNSPSTDLHLSQPLLVGTTTLKPGDYSVKCVTSGAQSFLVVRSDDSGKEVARVPCTAEDVPAQIKVSEFRSRTDANGAKTLTSVRIKGETIAHVVVN